MRVPHLVIHLAGALPARRLGRPGRMWLAGCSSPAGLPARARAVARTASGLAGRAAGPAPVAPAPGPWSVDTAAFHCHLLGQSPRPGPVNKEPWSCSGAGSSRDGMSRRRIGASPEGAHAVESSAAWPVAPQCRRAGRLARRCRRGTRRGDRARGPGTRHGILRDWNSSSRAGQPPLPSRIGAGPHCSCV